MALHLVNFSDNAQAIACAYLGDLLPAANMENYKTSPAVRYSHLDSFPLQSSLRQKVTIFSPFTQFKTLFPFFLLRYFSLFRALWVTLLSPHLVSSKCVPFLCFCRPLGVSTAGTTEKLPTMASPHEDDEEWDKSTSEIQSEDSDDLHDNRPNRWKGPPQSWRSITEEERLTYNALERLKNEDLSLHLYNAFNLKQGAPPAAADGGSSQEEVDLTTSIPEPDTAATLTFAIRTLMQRQAALSATSHGLLPRIGLPGRSQRICYHQTIS